MRISKADKSDSLVIVALLKGFKCFVSYVDKGSNDYYLWQLVKAGKVYSFYDRPSMRSFLKTA